MKDYVVQSGPLRTFESLYDPRFEKLKHVADYHTIAIIGKPGTQRRLMAEMRRSTEREITFVSSLFSAFAQGARTIFGIRDITGEKAAGLAKKLWDSEGIKWHRLSYGASEDDFTLVELKDFAGGFQLVKEFVPPSEGLMIFSLTTSPFETYQNYWNKACEASLKSKEDRFRRDVLALAHEAKLTLWSEEDGSYTIVLHPKMQDVEAVEQQITAAGEKAGMSITFAPGLFS